MTWTEIGSQTLESAASSIVFNSGLSGYEFYRITMYLANDANVKNVYLRFNGDTGTNYDYQRISADRTTVDGARTTGDGEIVTDAATQPNANAFGLYQLLIAKPAAGVPAQVVGMHGVDPSPEMGLLGAEWGNAADLITSIDLSTSSGNFAAGTSALLEGLSA